MPTLGRHGIRCGLSLNQSSVWTYSAVARVSRSAFPTSLRVQRWVENADSGHPSCIAKHDTPAGPLGIRHLAASTSKSSSSDISRHRPIGGISGCSANAPPVDNHICGTLVEPGDGLKAHSLAGSSHLGHDV